MPRNKRIDIPGAVHHVMIRGLNRQDIFLNDIDRKDFLVRFEKGLSQTGCSCYAWVFLNNHVHLLIRTGEQPLGILLRKVLSGYAISFNRRHKRSGYLFQNRYKSVLCQEDTYFLELVRYIHLNPVRAGVSKTVADLAKYRWCGHAVIMGKRRMGWQARDEVLLRFSDKRREAVILYQQFVEDGMGMGRREELAGGGLRRSAGGWEGLRALAREKEYWRGDERILGDGAFVDSVLQAVEEKLNRREALMREGWNLSRLVVEVCKLMQVEPAALQKKGRANFISHAKSLICFLGYSRLGISGADLARYFHISRPSVSHSIQRGEVFYKMNEIKLLN
jgi:REP element-mobilizing transposase RayT